MYHISAKSQENVIGIHIERQLGVKDTQTLLPFLEMCIKKHGSIRVLGDLKDFKGIEFLGLLKVLLFVFRYRSRLDKKIVITDQKWVKNWVQFLSPFFKTDIQCFPKEKIEEAWEWVSK